MLHLSRICLVTTRTNYGLNNSTTIRKLNCLGRVIGQNGPSGRIAVTSCALSHILSRQDGRLMNRKRHFFSLLHGNGAVIHGKKCRLPDISRRIS